MSTAHRQTVRGRLTGLAAGSTGSISIKGDSLNSSKMPKSAGKQPSAANSLKAPLPWPRLEKTCGLATPPPNNAPSVYLTQPAIQDIEAIADYIASQTGFQQAERFLSKLDAKFARIT